MTLEGLLRDVPYEILQAGGGISQEVSGIYIDSRRVKAGGLFICLLGLSVDGHEFIDDVARAGGLAVLVEKYCEQTTYVTNNQPGAVRELRTNPWIEGCGRIYPRPAGYTGAAQLRDSYPPGLTVIQVENTRQAMAIIAANAYGRPAEKLSLIGVTGTNGKTTTTHFIEEVLRICGHKTGIIGTLGARIGTKPIDIPFATSTTPDPLELQQIFAHMVERGVEYVVMEVSSHALAFYKVEGLIFDVGVFTNLTQDHLDLHGTMDNYRLAKALLFTQSRFAVVNAEDESTPVMLQHHGGGPYVTYGINGKAGLKALHIKHLVDGMTFDIGGGAIDDDGVLVSDAEIKENNTRKLLTSLRRGAPIISARYRLRRATGRPNVMPPGQRAAYKTAALGRTGSRYRITLHTKAIFNIYNALATIGVCGWLGIPMNILCKAVAKIQGVPGRIQNVPNNRGVHVLVDYAHTPDGVYNIITSVREFTTGRIVIIFGCGGDRDKGKRPIMGQIAGEHADYCILTSDNPRTEDPHEIIAHIEEGTKPTGTPYEIIENRRDAIFAGVKMLSPGDALIIAGKGHEDYQIIGMEKQHFSDYETALEALEQND